MKLNGVRTVSAFPVRANSAGSHRSLAPANVDTSCIRYLRMAYLLSSGLRRLLLLGSVSTAQFFIGANGADTSWPTPMRRASDGEFVRDAGFAANICVDLDAGCEVSCQIVATVIAKAALGAERYAFAGGVAEPLRTYLPAWVAARLERPRHDTVVGAILLVGGTQAAPGENSCR